MAGWSRPSTSCFAAAPRRQQEQDNIQQWINQQNQSDIQRMNQEQFDQQQQIINNNRSGDR